MATTDGSGLTFEQTMQIMNLYNQANGGSSTTTQNNAGSGEKTAGGVLSTIAPIASAIPYVGPLVSAGLSIGGSLLQGDAAKKQQQQAASLKQQEAGLMPAPLAKGLQQKATADELAAQAGMPGLKQYQDALQQDFATHLRAIHNSSINGGEAVHAIATTLGLNNDSLSKLFGENSQYQAGLQKDARNDMWNLGLMRHQNEQELFHNFQAPMLQQATALENASFANKNTAVQGALGAISSTATNMFSTANKQRAYQNMLDALRTAGTPKAAALTPFYQKAQDPASTGAYTGMDSYLPNAPADNGTAISTAGTSDMWNYGLSSTPSYATP